MHNNVNVDFVFFKCSLIKKEEFLLSSICTSLFPPGTNTPNDLSAAYLTSESNCSTDLTLFTKPTISQ